MPYPIQNITITTEVLKFIADNDEFKGRWKIMETLAPEKLTSLKRTGVLRSGTDGLE